VGAYEPSGVAGSLHGSHVGAVAEGGNRAFLETTDLPFREASNIRRLAADDDTETARLLEVSVLLQIAVDD
jgi:hypothetical protein